MGNQSISYKKLKFFHKKWQSEYDRWRDDLRNMHNEHLDALDMLNHIEDQIRELQMDVDDMYKEIEDHENLMAQHESIFQDVKGGVIDSSQLTDEGSMHNQSTMHDYRRQKFMELKKKHTFLFKLLKRVSDAIDFS